MERKPTLCRGGESASPYVHLGMCPQSYIRTASGRRHRALPGRPHRGEATLYSAMTSRRSQGQSVSTADGARAHSKINRSATCDARHFSSPASGRLQACKVPSTSLFSLLYAGNIFRKGSGILVCFPLSEDLRGHLFLGLYISRVLGDSDPCCLPLLKQTKRFCVSNLRLYIGTNVTSKPRSLMKGWLRNCASQFAKKKKSVIGADFCTVK